VFRWATEILKSYADSFWRRLEENQVSMTLRWSGGALRFAPLPCLQITGGSFFFFTRALLLPVQ